MNFMVNLMAFSQRCITVILLRIKNQVSKINVAIMVVILVTHLPFRKTKKNTS